MNFRLQSANKNEVNELLLLIKKINMNLIQPLSQKDKQIDNDSLEHLLNQKITYGTAQDKLIRPLNLLLFNQGCQSIAIGLLLPVLQQEWNLSSFQQSLLIFTVYLGVTLGSYLQSFSDRYGRYTFIMYSAILQCIFGVLSCICWNYQTFVFIRFFYGIGIGICLPVSASYITEVSPIYIRATLLSRSRVYWVAGYLFSCALGWVFLRDNRWRILLFAICISGFYALYEHWKDGKQSLRYLWVTDQKQKVLQLVNFMCKLNNKPLLTQLQIQNLMIQYKHYHKIQNQTQIPMKQLFNNKYYPSTVRLLVAWFSVCFIYYGIMILLPSILDRVFIHAHRDINFKYVFLIVVSFFQIIGYSLTSYVIDHPQIGRKKGVYYGLFIVCAMCIGILVIGENNIIVLFILMSVIKFMISISFMVLYPYTAEIYETMIRGKALGIASACGRLSVMVMGFLGVYAMNWCGGYGLYIIFVVLSGIAGYGGYTMPYCTGNRPIS